MRFSSWGFCQELYLGKKSQKFSACAGLPLFVPCTTAKQFLYQPEDLPMAGDMEIYTHGKRITWLDTGQEGMQGERKRLLLRFFRGFLDLGISFIWVENLLKLESFSEAEIKPRGWTRGKRTCNMKEIIKVFRNNLIFCENVDSTKLKFQNLDQT